MYADDTAILERNKNPKYTAAAINQHLEKLDDWFVKWKIALNVSKTEAVYVAKGEKKHKPVINIKNKMIPWSQQAKYLGIILDKKLTWQSHISSIKTNFRNATRKLYPLIARDSDMKRKYKILIYTAILRPIITYGCPIWGAAAKSNINKLEVLENNIIRQIYKAGWYMRNEDITIAIKLPSLKDFIKKISVNFYNNIENIGNEAIQQIDKYTPILKAKDRERFFCKISFSHFKMMSRAIPVSISLHPVIFITPCCVLPKQLDVPDQQTSLVRFLIEELGVLHITITTIHQSSQLVNSHPLPCFRLETRTTKIQQHKSSNIQLVIPEIRPPSGAMGPKKYSVVLLSERL
ncbi:RNA-directed DNA polymerase from mobile element jockey [Araneus ventricosus]|uniref:RNA-directed DNA polymerase from mobile element jockey n=1 Tax=Araneus ventricosus TaxID=182803 RepID=A0A4Y2P3I3_ARAVE|nr:RNA-directed DNA polymerase from mobile element jockey [Araneus ventricosus]